MASKKQAAQTQSAPLDADLTWYKSAIIYELHIRAFADSDGDGIGDFKGLTQRLDYLQELGVTAIWLLPFYPSPLRDDGYDIADYTTVNPSYGTLADFKRFVREAHKRGLRVITELVINHTSDQHAWFKRALRAKKGSSHRDFYVWSDTDDKYRNVRIIFKDFERSNWTWSHEAQAYYWHRFYSHQPDLNFDNPDVSKAIFEIMDFWFDMGVDGMRLDAVPYIYEREGTNCENLPETHEFLKKLRAHVDRKYPGRMLLAEANMWPEESVAYFGDGDECHMAFHFPVMPRLFMAIHQEDRFPIVDILQQTPDIPENAQWALFLRNHDELTLEMVTDEERDYMYRTYAHDRRARINLGIRRRLAPLLGNNRRKIELMNGLLYSLPGTPVLYYGDEIGMGDNIYLGDRDAVRTPMQWSPDRNAGFSQANPQRLYMPVIIDPEYNYETINVEAQAANPQSLLWWMRRLTALRQRHPVFGRGSIRFLSPENPKILAFVREDESETVLVVANLSRFVQGTDLDLSQFIGATPVELFGRTKFPPVTDKPYFVTLGPHSFYWFELRKSESQAGDAEADREPPTLTVAERWDQVFEGRGLKSLEAMLPEYLAPRRWFAGKARTIRAVRVQGGNPMSSSRSKSVPRLALVTVEYTEGEPETYSLPVMLSTGERAEEVLSNARWAAIARIQTRAGADLGLLHDASSSTEFGGTLLSLIAQRKSLPVNGAELVGWSSPAGRKRKDEQGEPLKPSLSTAEQSNTSVQFGSRYMLKLFRRVYEGANPDFEIGRFLTERAAFEHTPAVVGALELQPKRAEPRTLAILQEYVENEGDAWRHARDMLGRYFELPHVVQGDLPPAPEGGLLEMLTTPPPEPVHDAIGHYWQYAELLGERTAQMHLALASDTLDPAFAPEPFAAPHYQRSLYQSMRNLSRQSLQALRRNLNRLPDEVRSEATELLTREDDLLRVFHRVTGATIGGVRIRTHGDYHLGQVLYTGKDFKIIDFEGEPARSIGERRLKRSALRDVAGMIRSFHYATYASLFQHIERGGSGGAPESLEALERSAAIWRSWVSATFLRTYLAKVAGSDLVPSDESQLRTLLQTFLLEKAIYELGYELNNRPTWVRIPVRGILALMRQGEG